MSGTTCLGHNKSTDILYFTFSPDALSIRGHYSLIFLPLRATGGRGFFISTLLLEDLASSKNFLKRVGSRGVSLFIFISSDRFNHFYYCTKTCCLTSFAGPIDKPQLMSTELEQVEAAYALKDRSWRKIIRGRSVCAMGKFKLSDNAERVKAAAHSTKEKAQSSGIKRKGSESTSPHDSPLQRKRSRTPQEALVESSRLSVPSSTVVEPTANREREVLRGTDAARSSYSPLRLSAFFYEIRKSLSRSSPIQSAEGSPDIEQKFHMTFDKTTSVNATTFMFAFSLYRY